MHENRETSGAPRSFQDRGRSEKAQSRTSDMHALEESDRTVVPVNQPNKEGSSSAEVGEGRVRTKENIAQSNTSPIGGRSGWQADPVSQIKAQDVQATWMPP